MASALALPVWVTVSPWQLGAIVRLLQEFAGAEGQFLTDLLLPLPTAGGAGYAVAVGAEFSALLQVAAGIGACPVSLSFEPEAIADFMAARGLAGELGSPNAAAVQTAFTGRLMTLLMQPQAHAAEVTMLVEQSELLNQVTQAIGRSLELPQILETAVERVRQFLQVDRLLIHQFDIPAPICVRQDDGVGVPATLVDGVTYEACAHGAIPSVLNQLGDHWIKASRQLREKYQSGLVVSQTILDGLPELAEVLQFPAQAQVRSELTVPILVQGQLWGLLIAHQCDHERDWDQANRRFLQQIVDHLSIAIYQAKLFAQLQEQAATLEQMVTDRTRELRDALRAAQSADVAKSEFLATMSHELRTPLTCIIGMSSTLLRHGTHQVLSDERRQAHLQIIHDRGEGLLTMINDILELANIEAGRTGLNIRSFHLFQLMNQTLREMEEAAQAKQIELVLDRAAGLTNDDCFEADPQRVRQILLNLLNNAVKFTPAGGTVTLRIRQIAQGVVFQVEDTGIGIAPVQQPLVFQKFQQLDSSYQRHYEGTGLGLALTKQLVEMHGGKIEFTSEVDVGTVFTVFLPGQTNVPAAIVPSSVLPIHRRIMLVEAVEEQAAMICDLLTAADCQVLWMTDLEMALYQLGAAHPDIVIVNCGQVSSPQILADGRQMLQAQSIKFLAMVPDDLVIADHADLMADDYWVPTIGQPELLVNKVMQLATDIENPLA
jgi:two-component system, sensor histidine kinase and response regulator